MVWGRQQTRGTFIVPVRGWLYASWDCGAVSSLRRSLLFSFLERYAGIAIGLATTVIAARLLTPADFGVFAVGISVIMLIDVLRDFGAGNYLVQLEVLDRAAVRSAFTISCLISGICAAILILSAAPIGRFYGDPGVGHVVLVLSGALLLNPFSTPAAAMLRRQMAFDKLALVSVASSLGQLVTIILLAKLGQGYMAMAWASLAAVLIRTIGSNLVHPIFWAFRPGFAEWRSVLSFGIWSTAGGIVNVINDTLPQLIIGRVLGTVPVGVLGRAQMVCQLPDKLIAGGLNPVVLPALAQHARNGGSLKDYYLVGISYMAAVHIPALVCLALLAEPIVHFLLGPQWGEVPQLVRFMAMGMIWLFPAFLTYPILVSLGRIRDTLAASLISIPPSIMLIALAAPQGIAAVAATTLITAPLQAFVAVTFVRRRVEVTWASIGRATWPGCVATLGAASGIVAVMSLLGFRTALSFSETLIAIVLAALGWLAGLWLSGHPLIGEIRRLWGRVRGWA